MGDDGPGLGVGDAATPHTQSLQASTAPKPGPVDEVPTLDRAKAQFAKAHGLQVSEVTEKQLEESTVGVEGWACYGLNSAAHGPVGNALYRSFKKHPAAQETYRWLFEDLKKRFRQSWATQRSFDFIEHRRIHVISTATKQEEIGSWKNRLQLENHYGGVGIPEAVRQAENYIANCRNFQDRGF